MGNLTILTKCTLFSGLTPTAAKCPAFPSAKRYKQAIKKKSTMTLTSKLKNLSGLKTQNNEKGNISLTISMQLDNFIARGQGQENKNLVFFPTALKRKKELQTHKARVMQATQTLAPPKLTLHMLSANAHKKNRIINY